MTSVWQVAPVSERRRLSEQEKAEMATRRLHLQANPQLATIVATTSELYPTMSPPVIMGASMAGITDPAVLDEIATADNQDGWFGAASRFLGGVDDAVWGTVKGTTRWLGMAAEGLYDEILTRPMREAALYEQQGKQGWNALNPLKFASQEGRDVYAQAGNAPFGSFGSAIGELAKGNDLNLGSGIFAQSNLAPEVEEQLGRVQQTAAGIGTPAVDRSLQDWGLRAVGTGWSSLDVEQRKMIYSAKEREHIITRSQGVKGGSYVYQDIESGQDVEIDLGGFQTASGFGNPITEADRSEAETVFQSYQMPFNRGANSGVGTFAQVSPGRVAAGLVVEPGSTQYSLASGIIDAGVQIFADPADKGLDVLRLGNAGRKALGLGDEAAVALRTAQDNRAVVSESQKALDEITGSGDLEKLAGYAESTQRRATTYATTSEVMTGPQKQRLQALANRKREAERLQKLIDDASQQQSMADVVKSKAGLLGDSPRVDVMPDEMNKWITGRTATPFVESFTSANTMDDVDKLLRHVKTPVSRSLRVGLKEAKTNSEVVALLLPEIGGAVTESGLSLVGRHISPLVTAGVDGVMKATGRRYRVGQKFNGSRLNRWFAEVAPNSMDLTDLDRSYDKLKLLGQNLNLKYSDELDGIFEDFARLEDGDFAEGYNVMKRFMEYAFDDLAEAGLDQNVATEVTKFAQQFRTQVNTGVLADLSDDADWFVNRVGDVVREPNASTKLLVDGREISSPGPQLITELFNGQIALADHNLIRKAVGDTERLGKITNKLATRGADKFFEERWGLRVANTILSQVWKPLVLLRVAWPVRVVGEEQARMAASNLGSIFNISPGSGHHPLSYFAMAMGRKGMTDVTGGEISAAEEFLSAMARRANFDGEMGARGSRYWTTISRGDADYADALVTELNMLWSDPVVQQMFSETIGGLDDAGRYDEMVNWLMDGEGTQWLRQLTRNAPPETQKAMRTPQGVRAYVEGVYARAHLKAGGQYRYITPDGKWVDDAGLSGQLTPDELRLWGNRSGYEITRPGNEEILEAYSTGKLGDLNVRNKLSSDKNVLANQRNFVDYDEVKRQTQRVQRQAAARGEDFFPEKLKGVKYTDSDVGKIKGDYDKAVERMFDFFMTRPTNRLSRSPAFRETYWKRIADMKPYIDDASWEKIMVQADEAGMATMMFGKKGSSRATDVAKTRKMSGAAAAGDLGTMTLEEADVMAKAFALETTKDLLYDLSKRHNASEALRIIMPFAEAFGEVSSRWANIMSDQMLKPGRRFQQVVESGRESNPFIADSGFTNEGFLYDNDQGDEVFAFPWPLPFANGGKFEYQVGSLNFINSVIPGFGPALQLPANMFLPDSPEWDGIRETISPYGGEGNLFAQWMPSYMKRALGSIEVGRDLIGDTESVRMFESTVAGVMQQMALEDPAGYQAAMADPELNAQWLDRARSDARSVYLVRSIGTFMGPTSPSFQFQTEDKNGTVWAMNAFAQEYRKLLDLNQGDAMAASSQFFQAFGVNPAPLAASKSVTIDKRSVNKEGNAWQRANAGLFAAFPSIAYYFGPTDVEGGEFDYNAWQRQFKEGTRKPLTQQEYQATINDFYARVDLDNQTKLIEAAYGHTLDQSAEDWGGGEYKLRAQQEVTNYRNSLVSKYPGYDPTSIKPAGVASRTSVTEMIGELTRMVDNKPDALQGDPTLFAAEQYLEYRKAAIAVAQQQGFMSFSDAGNFETLTDDRDHPAFQLRNWLRGKAQELNQQYPTFQPLYDEVFNREMVRDEAVEQQRAIDEIGGGY